MMRRFTQLVIFLLSFQQVTAHSVDSVRVTEILNMGRNLEKKDREASIALFKQALRQADSIGFLNSDIAEIDYKLANYEYYRGNTEVAITYALRSLSFYKDREDDKQATRVMILVGDILRGNELFDQSHEYLSNALLQAREHKDSTLLGYAYNRLAALGIDDVRVSWDSTEKFATLSLLIARIQKNDTLTYNNLNILGVLEIMRGNYPKSLGYLKEAHTISRNSFPEDEPLILHNMARCYFITGPASKAVELEKQAFQLAQAHQIPQYVRLASSFLKDYYISVGNFEEALSYAVNYYQAKDFILTQKVLVQLKEFNNQIENEKQRSENQRLVYEQKIIDGRLRNYLIIGILLFSMLAITTGFIIYQQRQRRHIRKIASQLDQSNQVLTRFISVLGHDLRSPFNAILGFTDLLKNDPSMSPQDKVMAIERLYTVSRSTHKLLERILEWSHLQSGSVKPVKKSCDLSELIRETIHVLEPTAFVKNIEIRFDDQGPLHAVVDENMILTVIRNILSNAIKFSQPGSCIDVWTSASNNMRSISIRDTGIGISPDNLNRLFHLDNNYKSRGTAGESGTGLGLILCKEYLALHDGTLVVTSEEGKGSTFTINTP